MPHVLFVNHTKGFSGAEVSLERILGALPQRGITTTLATPPKSALTDHLMASGKGADVVRGPALDIGSRSSPALALRALLVANLHLVDVVRRVRPDLIHANSLRAGLTCVLAARATRTPLVVHARDASSTERGHLLVSRLLLAQVARTIAISRYVARQLPAPAARIAVVYDGIDVTRYDRPPDGTLEDIRNAAGLDGVQGPILMMIGQITPWKGHADAVQALILLRRAGHDAHLAIVGGLKFTHASARHDNAAYHAELRRQVSASGLEDSVHWLGERGDVPAVVHLADYVLVPSWQEPFGLVVIEAMAAGKVVVATNVGGPSEVIRDGETGFLIPPSSGEAIAAAVVHCLQQPVQASQIARAAQRDVAQRFSLDAFADALVELYTSVLTQQANRRAAQ